MNVEEIIGNLYIRLVQSQKDNSMLSAKIAEREKELENLANLIATNERPKQEPANQ